MASSSSLTQTLFRKKNPAVLQACAFPTLACASQSTPLVLLCSGAEGLSMQRPCLLPEWLICQVHASSSLLRGGPCSKSCQGGPCVTVQLVGLISIQLAPTLGSRDNNSDPQLRRCSSNPPEPGQWAPELELHSQSQGVLWGRS